MGKYNLQKTVNLVNSCASAARIDFKTLAQKENLPDQNLAPSDFNCISTKIPVVNGDALARSFSSSRTSCSMDFAFVLDSGKTLLGEMKFNVNRSIRKQLKSLLDKYKGSYTNLYSLVSGNFYRESYVLFNDSSFEECKSVLSRLNEEYQEDSLVVTLELHFFAATLSMFSKKFF